MPVPMPVPMPFPMNAYMSLLVCIHASVHLSKHMAGHTATAHRIHMLAHTPSRGLDTRLRSYLPNMPHMCVWHR